MGYLCVHCIDIWETYSEMGNSKESLELRVCLPRPGEGEEPLWKSR